VPEAHTPGTQVPEAHTQGTRVPGARVRRRFIGGSWGSEDGRGSAGRSSGQPAHGSYGYGCWKPAAERIFCASGVLSHFTNAAAASAFSDVFRVAAG
jgi:hypothetical protein